MPLKPGTLLASRGGIIELEAEIVDGGRDTPEGLLEAVRARILEHQREIMTDPDVLGDDDAQVASAFVSRDPLPEEHVQGLGQLGLRSTQTDGGAQESSLFSRLSKNRRSQLHRFVIGFLRAREVSRRLGELEAALLEDPGAGALHDPEHREAACARTIEVARDCLGLTLEPGAEGLGALDELVLRDKGARPGRWVLHPAAVIGIAAFAGESIRAIAPGSAWTEDEDEPLHVRAGRGVAVATDPGARVVDWVLRGRQARLADYAEAVTRQSLTSTTRT